MYSINTKNNSYFDEVILDIIKDNENNFSNNIIVLQNYTDAQIFKYKFLQILEEKKISAAFLPSFQTAQSFLSEYIKKNGQILLEYSQQIIILSKIINDYKEISFSASESIKIATELYKIKEQISKYNISLDNINGWVEEDLAEHWWATSNLLETSFKNFDEEINKYRIFSDKKIDEGSVIFYVGLVDVSEDFLKSLNSMNCQKIFFEPIYLLSDSLFLDKIKLAYSRANITTKNIFKNCSPNPIKYYEFKDNYLEEDYIIYRACKSETSLLIVTNDENLNKKLCSRFDNSGIEYNSFFKTPYINFLESELFCNLAKFKSENGSINSLSCILNSRMMQQVLSIRKLLDQLNKSDLFFEDFTSAKQYFFEDEKLSEFYVILANFLDSKSTAINDLLAENLKIFIQIYNLFECISNNVFTSKFESFLTNIISTNYFPVINDLEDYESYITKLFSLKYTRPVNSKARIIIAKYADSLYIDADEVIFSGFNQENIIPSTKDDIWMTQKILKKLGILSEDEDFEKIRYYISSKLHLNNITITRPIYNSGELLEKCSILNFLENIDEGKIVKANSKSKIVLSNFIEISNKMLPRTLFASNIEMLLRNPYGFIMRKILKIIPSKNFIDPPENKTFGSITHRIIENISENKNNLTKDEIIENSFDEFRIPSLQRRIWQSSLAKISSQIEKINECSLKASYNIYSEIKGEIEIEIAGNKIKICAIADRIEISDKKIRIIDFKTGVVPTKSEVDTGKSPQLIIESIICMNNGFKDINYRNQELEIVYYKISTKEPYIEEKIIQTSKKELEFHLQLMIKLLEYYYSSPLIAITNEPLADSWRSTFDDYDFFRRIL
jgi:ATP-dependent helicase/nuclease subunit B